jgi:hypothetical protein
MNAMPLRSLLAAIPQQEQLRHKDPASKLRYRISVQGEFTGMTSSGSNSQVAAPDRFQETSNEGVTQFLERPNVVGSSYHYPYVNLIHLQ